MILSEKGDRSTINLLFVANDKFCPHLAVTLMSIAKCTAGPIRAFVVTDDATSGSRVRVEAAVPSIEIRWLECPPLNDMPKSTGGVRSISYGRLFGPGQVCGLTHRLIYLDVDILVLRDLRFLWDFDLGDEPIAAVRDFGVPWIGTPRWGISAYECYGFLADAPYFNAGVLIIDVRSWTKNRYQQQCLEFLSSQIENRFADQDVLNAVFYQKWKPLPLEWNVLTNFLNESFIEIAESKEPVLKSRDNPAILHFAGSRKPWSPLGCSDIFARQWIDLARSSPFRHQYKSPSWLAQKSFAVRYRFTHAVKALLGR